jgi:RNase H-fold protein (predicted Holliday junction resolvase)
LAAFAPLLLAIKEQLTQVLEIIVLLQVHVFAVGLNVSVGGHEQTKEVEFQTKFVKHIQDF